MTPKITIHTTTEDTPKAMAPTDDDGTDSVVCGVAVAVNKKKHGCKVVVLLFFIYIMTGSHILNRKHHVCICQNYLSHPFMT